MTESSVAVRNETTVITLVVFVRHESAVNFKLSLN